MGYTTEFKGHLGFAHEVTVQQIAAFNKVAGEDAREHPEWEIPGGVSLYYIDLKVTDALDGVEWSGAEKSYYMVEQVNFVTAHMRREWPEFTLCGSMRAQGEEHDDSWDLVVNGGVAVRVDRVLPGFKVECPECGCEFRTEAPKD